MSENQLANNLTSAYYELCVRFASKSMFFDRLVGGDTCRRVDESSNDVIHYSGKPKLTSYQRPNSGFYIDDILRKNTERNVDTTRINTSSIDIEIKQCYSSRGIYKGKITSSRSTVLNVNCQSSGSLTPEITNTQPNNVCHTPECLDIAMADHSSIPQHLSGVLVNMNNKISTISLTSLLSDVTSHSSQYNRKQPSNQPDFKLPTWVYCTRYSDRPSSCTHQNSRP